MNRTDLVRRFGVSMSQASADIGRYLALSPPGVAYDKSAKRYVADETFRPVLTPPDSTQFLGELRLVDLGIMPTADTLLGEVPPFATAPTPERPVDPFVLRGVLAAIRTRAAVEVRYQSMSRPMPTRRVIEPHALAHDGFRWHARAYDHQSGEFRDFVIGRMADVAAVDAARAMPTEDRDWNQWVELRIAPHPALTPAQAKAIRLDYGIAGNSATLAVRRALLFYALRRLGLDTNPDARPPNEQQIVLVECGRDPRARSRGYGRRETRDEAEERRVLRCAAASSRPALCAGHPRVFSAPAASKHVDGRDKARP